MKCVLGRWLLALCLLLAAPAWGNGAGALRERYAALRAELSENSFKRPVHLDSREATGELRGDVHAVLEHPFASLGAALRQPESWCELLILVFNIKHCESTGAAPKERLMVSIGRKHDQPLADAHRVEFTFDVAAAAPEQLRIELNAASGPLGTRDYRIALEVIPLDGARSFMHLRYSYASGMTARLAMRGYLATIGRDKVGFSVVGRQPDGSPLYVDGLRGVVERNTMRYYLAIDAYLDSLSVAPRERLEKRLTGWFDATERYPLQLHEMERGEYLAMKRKEAGAR